MIRRSVLMLAVLILAFAWAFELIPALGFFILLGAVVSFAWSAGWIS